MTQPGRTTRQAAGDCVRLHIVGKFGSACAQCDVDAHCTSNKHGTDVAERVPRLISTDGSLCKEHPAANLRFGCLDVIHSRFDLLQRSVQEEGSA